jgi:hypothetical protein
VKFLIEIKATVGNCVRMTETQGKKAKVMPDRYALCVVALSGEEEINSTTVIGACKFVFDIGTRVRPLVDALESIEASRCRAVTLTGKIELEMEDQIAKFKVGHEVWEGGVGFDDAVQLFGGRDASVGGDANTTGSDRPTDVPSSDEYDIEHDNIVLGIRNSVLETSTTTEPSSDLADE